MEKTLARNPIGLNSGISFLVCKITAQLSFPDVHSVMLALGRTMVFKYSQINISKNSVTDSSKGPALHRMLENQAKTVRINLSELLNSKVWSNHVNAESRKKVT